MKAKHKKIIGREFLILVALSVIFGLTFLGLSIYDYSLQSRWRKVYREKELIIDEINSISSKPYYQQNLSKKSWFYKELDRSYDLSNISIDSFWNSHLANLNNLDTLKKRWNQKKHLELRLNLSEMGLHTPEEYAEFLSDSATLHDLKSKILKLEYLMKKQQGRLDSIEMVRIYPPERAEQSLVVLLILGAILYILRPFIHAIKWSIKAVKTDVED